MTASPPPEKTFDVVALGEAMVEFNQRDPGEPVYHRGFGGDTSNCVIAARRLGARCAYITQVGDDVFGAELIALWEREKIDTGGVRLVRDAPTGVYFVSHTAGGHEFSYRRAGSAASRMRAADLPRHLVAQSRWLHVSGISLAISDSACDAVLAAVQHARDVGTRVSFDLNFRQRLWSRERAHEVTLRMLAHTDLFFPSADEAELLTGLGEAHEIVDWAHRHGAANVALKLGAHGALVSTGDTRHAVPGFPVDPVDATGAGDCFAGACLARLAAGDGLPEAAAYANVAAALSTQAFGAIAGMPAAAEVERARTTGR